MRPRTVAAVAAAVDGILDGAGDAMVTGAAVDSRSIGRGDLFFALPGERTDGHAYVADAFAHGAAGAVISSGANLAGRGEADTSGPVIRVADPGGALLDLAASERRSIEAPVVGITGSSGKTCTKDLTVAALGVRLAVTGSPASFNNEVGLPLTLLAAGAGTEAVVCEMGARGLGHIRLLCEVARPTIGVVTNVGIAHLGLFGSVEAIREAKAELPAAIPAGGTAVLNSDDPVVLSYAERTAARVVTFGLGAGADVRADQVEVDPRDGRARFRLSAPGGSADVRLAVPGEHMIPNALAAAAVALTLGLSPGEIAGALGTASVSGGRMEVFETTDGVRVIDDAYNANPASVGAALRALRTMAAGGRTIAVLGEMAELGSISVPEHERIGELVARLGIDALVTVGEPAQGIAAGAEREGMEPGRTTRSADVDDALDAVRHLAAPGDVVLVKGSRVAGLDRVAGALRSTSTGDADPAGEARDRRFADAMRAGS